MRRLVTVVFIFATSQAWAAFGYYSPITINSSQVPSTQTDFPVLVNITDARFKTVGNSGHVQNSSGFDIRPYTDSTLTTAITGYELERYNASTGEVVMWVKVSSLSSSTTPFVLAYGNAALTTDGSSTTTWSNSFRSVYHLKNGSTLSLSDSTSTADNLTNNNSVTATAGKIDGAASFASASSQSLNNGTNLNTAAVTLSAWANPTSLSSAYNAVMGWNDNTSFGLILVKSNGKIAPFTNRANYDGTGSHTLSTGTTYYLVLTYSNAAGLVGYVNGASDGTASAGGTLTTGSISLYIGKDAVNNRYWNGMVDEARTANVARSADWIATEYNNQSAPGTFETLGTEVAVGVTANGWFYFFP